MRAMEPFHFFLRFFFLKQGRWSHRSLPTALVGIYALYLFFKRNNSSLPESGTTLHLIISSPNRHTYLMVAFWRFWNGKNYGLDASCRVYREPYNLYWEEPTESGARSTKKLSGVDHQASFFSHTGILPSFPFSFLALMCSLLALRLPFLTERYPHTIIPHLSHPPSLPAVSYAWRKEKGLYARQAIAIAMRFRWTTKIVECCIFRRRLSH